MVQYKAILTFIGFKLTDRQTPRQAKYIDDVKNDITCSSLTLELKVQRVELRVELSAEAFPAEFNGTTVVCAVTSIVQATRLKQHKAEKFKIKLGT